MISSFVQRTAVSDLARIKSFYFQQHNGRRAFVRDKVAVKYRNVWKWLSLLFFSYWLNRLIFCDFLSIPPDYSVKALIDHVNSVSNLFLFGFIQGWSVDLFSEPHRGSEIFSFKRAWFFVLFLCSIPVFSLIGMIPAIDGAIDDDTTNVSLAKKILLLFLMCLSVGFIAWHCYYAKKLFRGSSSPDFINYVFARLVIFSVFLLLLFLVYMGFISAKFHLHHYFIAWLLSLFASFNHPISLSLLATCAGVFVQGISSYSAAPIFMDTNTEIISFAPLFRKID